jgi:autotransporter-associated beta strand protein
MNLIRKLAMAVVLTAAATTTSMAFPLEWSIGGLSNNWSDNSNWVWIYGFPSWSVSAVPPGPSDVVSFEDQLYTIGFNPGWTNLAGAVNNIVDTNSAAGAVNYTAVSTTGAPHFYTTLINPGVTLTLGGLGTFSPTLAVGDMPGYIQGYYTGSGTNFSTITGPGTLLVNDANGLISVGMRNGATLDLRGLNTFNATVSNLWLGVTADNSSTSGPKGSLYLGQTNTITTSADPAAPGILLATATNAQGTAVMTLGSSNRFNTDALVVGGRLAASGTILQFGASYLNANPLPTFTLRGSAGNTAASTFSIGDLAADTTSFSAIPFFNGSFTAGIADFSGGTVDIWVDSLYIGRSTPSTAQPTSAATGQGTLIVENGTVTATNVFMNYKMTAANNTAGSGSGLVLRSNAMMNVIKDLYLGFRTNGTNNSMAQAFLYVSNNAVLNVGGSILFTTNGSIGSWAAPAITLGNSSTINMTGGGNVVAGTLTGIGTISNANSISVSDALSANTDTGVGTLNLSSNLVVGGGIALTFNLGADNTIGGGVNDYINVGNNVTFNTNLIKLTYGAPLVTGLYTLMSYGGTQSGFVTFTNLTRSAIGLVQSNKTVGIYVTNLTPATLVWRATTSSTNWDGTSLVWNTNSDKFYALDNVIFDDTGVATNIVITTNIPGSITFTNNAKQYFLTQSSGKAISGFTGIDKWGTNAVVMGGSGISNSFTGPINIHQGSVLLARNSSSAAVFGGFDCTNAISISSGAMLDVDGGGFGSGSSPAYARYLNLAGSGIGGIGALVNNTNALGNTTVLRAVTLTDHATMGSTLGGFSLALSGLTAPYTYPLDLNGFNLSLVGTGAVQLAQFTITNSGPINGSINVNCSYLGIKNCIVDGPGTINLGAKYLNFYAAFTTGYVAKAISVANGGGILANATGAGTATTIPIKSAITIANNGTLWITNSGQPILASGQISGTGAGIAKFGNSNLVLSAANSYSGPTEVAAGSLVLLPGGSLASSLIQVDSTPGTNAPCTFDVTALSGGYTLPAGQTLTVNGFAAGNLTAGFGSTCSGFGTNLGNVSVAAGATLAPGSSLVEGTLTITSNLTFSGGSAIFKLDVVTNAGAGINDLIAVGGNLSFTGPTTIQISPFSALANKPYTLFTYGGTLSGTNNITVTSASLRYSFALDASVQGVLRVVPTGNAGNLLWRGGVAGNPNTWDVATTTNWFNGASLDLFSQGDSVTFDDTATTTTVTIATQVRPGFMTNNSTANYVLNGSGSLRSGTLVANSGTFAIANTNNNVFLGDGIQLNGGNVTFNQASNATITAQLSGSSGSLNKNGANTLTWTSPDSTTMSAQVNINAGNLRAASSNVLGSGIITIASGATLDINGQYMSAGTVHASGVGTDGLGALNNRGSTQTNALNNVVLDGNTTLGAASNRWDIAPVGAFSTATLQGNNFNVVKTGSQDLWIRPLTGTGLGDIDVSAGRLIFAGQYTTTGNSASNIVVRTNAVLGFANGIQDAGKNTLIQQGGSLYSVGNNEFDGAITLSNGLVTLESVSTSDLTPGAGSHLTLGGNLSGPAPLVVQSVRAGYGGTLTLTGSNSYTGGTIVNDGVLVIASSNSLPANTNVTLFSRVLYAPNGAQPAISIGPIVTPASVRLDMKTTNSAGGPAQAALNSDGGTWAGPIRITGNSNNCFANFTATKNGLTINGAIDATNFTANGLLGAGGGGVIINGDMADVTTLAGPGMTFNTPLHLPGSLQCANGDNQSGNMAKLVLNAPSNSWAAASFTSGMIQIGVDNAISPLSPLTVVNTYGTDHRFVLDLNGHSQGLGAFAHGAGNIIGLPPFEEPVWFGNSSTNADSTLTYVGTGTNTWAAFIVDAFDTNAPIQRKTGLTVTSGYLRLINSQRTDATDASVYLRGLPPGPLTNTYSGPTLVSGGFLRVDANILNSPVTVYGAGSLGGTGTLSGPVAIGTGGTLSPGPAIGNLVSNLVGAMLINNSLVFSNGSACFMKNYQAGGTSDQVLGLSTVTYGGTLFLTNLFNAPYTNGQVIKLFDAAHYQGAFSSIIMATNVVSYSDHLATDGAITILQALPSVNVLPCPMTVSKTPSSMTFSWPADHTGWRLTTQTNALTNGLRQTNTWYTVPGSSTTNQMTLPIDKNQPNIIYRLTYP